ncbi:dephospho-CoA kinase [Miniphocaeibacter halophilus]|uniref:Dephospho-CoA kinase n=1 Tax=Miniphocaeibacter halophilus TaxID=2931922 RepID=A0AC61MRD7_9FIRM|nr:dephospho-CoA kinase [Miniphocaeibacter halophilus]QQK07140.1 dephospho-CoA kinase [Miniphocaeibacter halophilus]
MNQNKKIFIITGTISSGKSTFSNILRQKGFKVIDADKIVHELYDEDSMKKQLTLNFGNTILVDGNINRKILGNIVFNNEEKKQLLETIVHPRVLDRIIEYISNSNDNIFIEIPLYYKVEKELIKKINNYKLILITIEKEIQIERLIKRNNITRKEAMVLIDNIEDTSKFSKKVDYTIENNGNLEDFKLKIEKFLIAERLDESNKENI